MTLLDIHAVTIALRLWQNAQQQQTLTAIVKKPTKALLQGVNQTSWPLTLGAFGVPNMIAIALMLVTPANHNQIV